MKDEKNGQKKVEQVKANNDKAFVEFINACNGAFVDLCNNKMTAEHLKQYGLDAVKEACKAINSFTAYEKANAEKANAEKANIEKTLADFGLVSAMPTLAEVTLVTGAVENSLNAKYYQVLLRTNGATQAELDAIRDKVNPNLKGLTSQLRANMNNTLRKHGKKIVRHADGFKMINI